MPFLVRPQVRPASGNSDLVLNFGDPDALPVISFGGPLHLGFTLLDGCSTHCSSSTPGLLCTAWHPVARKDEQRANHDVIPLRRGSLEPARMFSLARQCTGGGPRAALLTCRAASIATAAATLPTEEQQQLHTALKLPPQNMQQQQQHVPTCWLGGHIDVAGFTCKGYMAGGGKEHNQDRGIILQPFRSSNELLLGVLDGHGPNGHHVSGFLQNHLPAALMQQLLAAAAVTGGSSSGQKQRQQQQQQLSRVPLPYVVIEDEQPLCSRATARKTEAVARQRLTQVAPSTSSSSAAVAAAASNCCSAGEPTAVPEAMLRSVSLSGTLLSAAFAEADRLLVSSGVNVMDSGSTGLVCHVGPGSITTAWVGDSRAVLGRRLPAAVSLRSSGSSSGTGDAAHGPSPSAAAAVYTGAPRWQALPLSDDHKPERPDEQLRIVLNGGRVARMKHPATGAGVGPQRVWFASIDYPGLAMSRAFGDAPARRIGVTVEPQLYVHQLDKEDELLIAATDGVWDVLSNEDAVALAGNARSATEGAAQVVEAAKAAWHASERGTYVDDITAVVARVMHSSNPRL